MPGKAENQFAPGNAPQGPGLNAPRDNALTTNNKRSNQAEANSDRGGFGRGKGTQSERG